MLNNRIDTCQFIQYSHIAKKEHLVDKKKDNLAESENIETKKKYMRFRKIDKNTMIIKKDNVQNRERV